MGDRLAWFGLLADVGSSLASFVGVFIVVYILLPWIPINGFPAVFLDVQERRFHFFGLTLAAQSGATLAEVRAGITATEAPPDEWMFDWTFAEPPSVLARQREEALGG